MANSWTDQVKKKVLNFFELALVYGMVASLFALFFYPMWSEDLTYRVEWAVALITGVAAFVLLKGDEMNYTPKLVPVVVLLWLYAVGQAARTQSFAQLPCTNWEKTTCWACTETEYTQSGGQCVAGEEYECEVCTERTWRSHEWK